MTVIRHNSISGISSINAQSDVINFYDNSGVPISIAASFQVGTGATISGETNTIIASTNGSEKLRITSTGNIGIKTTTPNNNLTSGDNTQPSYAPIRPGNYIEIARTSGGDAGLLINKDTGQWLVGINNGDGVNAPLRFEYAAAGSSHPGFGNGTLGMMMKHDGNIGIGTASPDNKLHVFAGDSSGSSSAQAQFTIENSGNSGLQFLAGTSSVSEIRFGDSGDNGAGSIAYSHSDNSIRFGTNNGIEKVRIDANGRLLVGTLSSSGSDATVQSIGSYPAQFHRGQNDTGGPNVVLSKSRNTTYGSNTIVQSGDILGTIEFHGDDGTDYQSAGAYIQAFVDGAVGINSMPGRIVFSTTASGASAPTQRMTINSSGQLLVGAATAELALSTLEAHKPSGGSNLIRVQSGAQGSNELQDGEEVSFAAQGFANSNGRQGKIGAYKHSGITNAAGYIFLDQEDGGNSWIWSDNSGVLRISAVQTHIGTTSGSAVGDQTSDERLKNVGGNVVYGLNEILQLQPKQYALKTEPDTNKLGFIAQEVLPIIPEAVFDTNEELEGHQEGDSTKLGMQYVQLIPVLVNAIKEQQETITDLQTRLAALEAQ